MTIEEVVAQVEANRAAAQAEFDAVGDSVDWGAVEAYDKVLTLLRQVD